MKIEHVDGFIRLENDNQQAIWISEANAWEVLEFLYSRRDTLYKAANAPSSSNPMEKDLKELDSLRRWKRDWMPVINDWSSSH